MKRLLFLLPLLSACLALPAQNWTYTEFKSENPELERYNIYSDRDGYYAIGSTIRKVRSNDCENCFDSYHTPILQRLDHNFEVIWERQYKERMNPQYRSLVVTGDFIYLGGTQYDASEREKCKLVCMNREGDIQWERTYDLPGCGGGKSLSITLLPGGDLLASSIGLSCGSGKSGTYHMRIKPNGDVMWMKNYNAGRFWLWGESGNMVLDDGNIMKVNSCNIKSNAPGSHYKIWLYKFDIETGALLWEHITTLPYWEVDFKGGTRLPDGDFVFTGEVDDESTGVQIHKNIVARISQQGEILDYRVWLTGDYCEMKGIVALPDGRLFTSATVTGINNDIRMHHSWLQVYELDPSTLQVVDEFKMDTKSYGQLAAAIDGGMYINHLNQLIVMRAE